MNIESSKPLWTDERSVRIPQDLKSVKMAKQFVSILFFSVFSNTSATFLAFFVISIFPLTVSNFCNHHYRAQCSIREWNWNKNHNTWTTRIYCEVHLWAHRKWGHLQVRNVCHQTFIESEWIKWKLNFLLKNSYSTSVGVYREETVEILHKGTPEEEYVISGVLTFKADDGYKYNIKYTYDKSGSNVIFDRFPIRRIPPNALKSLVG